MTSSPWGSIQESTTLVPGVRWVSTPGHGGYMVTRQWAEKNLSDHAREGALRHGDYYCYEEDCDYAIVEWESPTVRRAQIARHNAWRSAQGKPLHTNESWTADLLRSLARWNRPYCDAAIAAFKEAA